MVVGGNVCFRDGGETTHSVVACGVDVVAIYWEDMLSSGRISATYPSRGLASCDNPFRNDHARRGFVRAPMHGGTSI